MTLLSLGEKNDPKNPPALDMTHLISDGNHVDIASICQYWDDEPAKWYPPDRSALYDELIEYYAEINLPTKS